MQHAGERTRPPTAVKPSLDQHRIAVMPFDHFSPDTSDEYFAGSLTAELNSCLAKISGREVIARSSAERARESKRSVPAIGLVLGVGTLLEGRVTKAGEQ